MTEDASSESELRKLTLIGEPEQLEAVSAALFEAGAGSNVWTMIADKLKLTERQRTKLLDRRADVRKLTVELRASTRECVALRSRMGRKNDALEADESREKRGLLQMEDLHGRLVYLSNWPALFKDGPDGWGDLAECAVPDSILGWIRAAHGAAVLEIAAGKPQPSE